ncbi:FAD-dependent monooxygenase [Arachidicoccus terrestris]|uniref:FAD-dependent monooxygenase n=1 Tax=Arachidicoccus terrestris TaxID=2875539 RepID=UPI001CC5A68D|nr:FAD-dependent monooxygenase [Arachidicoccus terrestris]UAY56930.1 FAD-dependent monooxygenase [Arachidicoccus terrestris]
MEKQKILISGASMAGLTLAYWLDQYGYQVMVVELSKGFRTGGSPIDVRGDALEVARKMGILDKIKKKEFIHRDAIVNAQDEILVQFALNTRTEYLGDIEIHRDDLMGILSDSIAEKNVELIFENRLTDIRQHEDYVDVTFKDGQQRRFDFVFGADGTHSAVRQLVFGEDSRFVKSFGAYFATVGISDMNFDRPAEGALIYQEVGKAAALYPYKDNITAMLAFRSPVLDWDYKDMEQHKAFLAGHFVDSGWRIPDILHKMLQSDKLYFDEVCQIHMPRWSDHRVALVGDAAYTAGFPTGMGTSLAMQGATLLAEAIHETDGGFQRAFVEYDRKFRPAVDAAQAKILRGLNWLLPPTAEDLKRSVDHFK